MFFECYQSDVYSFIKMSSFHVHTSCLLAETLPWRRTADLHVMLSVAAVAMLGWRLDKERLWELLQQEEGR